MGPFLIVTVYKFLKGTGYSGREYGVHTVDTCGISQHSKNAKALEDQIGYRIDGGEVLELDKFL